MLYFIKTAILVLSPRMRDFAVAVTVGVYLAIFRFSGFHRHNSFNMIIKLSAVLFIYLIVVFCFFVGYDMSTYIRRYAKYLNEKAFSYRQMAFDFCKVKRGLVEPIHVIFCLIEKNTLVTFSQDSSSRCLKI